MESFCYLESTIDPLGGTTAERKTRIGQAEAAFATLNNLLKTKEATLKTKLRILTSNVKSVLL